MGTGDRHRQHYDNTFSKTDMLGIFAATLHVSHGGVPDGVVWAQGKQCQPDAASVLFHATSGIMLTTTNNNANLMLPQYHSAQHYQSTYNDNTNKSANSVRHYFVMLSWAEVRPYTIEACDQSPEQAKS
jgi:hypothetical protein